MDYSYFYNSKNFDGSANEEYTGDSTSFLDKIFDFVKNLWDEYVKGKNSVKDPNNVDTNKTRPVQVLMLLIILMIQEMILKVILQIPVEIPMLVIV